MLNLLGPEVLDVEKYLRDPSAGVHIYGKSPIQPNRKMGHVNLRSDRT
jgi:5-(carboxyamino)imidazole ribonucleotide synthase